MFTPYRVICVFSFAILVTLLIPTAGSAQYARNRSRRSKNAAAEKKRSLHRLSPELRKHTALLQRALARYLSSGDTFTPYLTSHQFWLELRSSRVGSGPGRRSRQELEVLLRAYRELETDIERIMLDDQLALFGDALELNEVQYERIDAILRKDSEKKFRLLATRGNADASFLQELSTISGESEEMVRKVLFPEQLQIYEKRQTELKMIWTA